MYQPVIGLEIHVELATASKMFCGCPADHFGQPPNSQTCPVCLGLPGALPFPNKKAIDWAIRLGLALNCQVPGESKFDRKNYFYPDLPKGYQISQYDAPLCRDGYLDLEIKSEIVNPKSETNSKSQILNSKRIRIRRVHLEEDTGKLLHTEVDGQKCTLVDFNRSGVPLVEIVTEPDFTSGEEVDIFVKKLRQIVRYLEISTADMEKGSLRIEPNISIRQLPTQNSQLPNYKVEVKNINSFRFARQAIEYEIKRQTEILEKNETPSQETRGWSEALGQTVGQRSKEEAHDYRYFPEPDIPPLVFGPDYVQERRKELPEFPNEKKARFARQYELSPYQAELLTENPALANYFEQAANTRDGLDGQRATNPKEIANWIINKKIDIQKISPLDLLREIVSAKEVTSLPDGEMEKIIDQVLAENSSAVAEYQKGKTAVLGFLIGQAVRKIGPKIDHQALSQKLQEKLR